MIGVAVVKTSIILNYSAISELLEQSGSLEEYKLIQINIHCEHLNFKTSIDSFIFQVKLDQDQTAASLENQHGDLSFTLQQNGCVLTNNAFQTCTFRADAGNLKKIMILEEVNIIKYIAICKLKSVCLNTYFRNY